MSQNLNFSVSRNLFVPIAMHLYIVFPCPCLSTSISVLLVYLLFPRTCSLSPLSVRLFLSLSLSLSSLTVSLAISRFSQLCCLSSLSHLSSPSSYFSVFSFSSGLPLFTFYAFSLIGMKGYLFETWCYRSCKGVCVCLVSCVICFCCLFVWFLLSLAHSHSFVCIRVNNTILTLILKLIPRLVPVLLLLLLLILISALI